MHKNTKGTPIMAHTVNSFLMSRTSYQTNKQYTWCTSHSLWGEKKEKEFLYPHKDEKRKFLWAMIGLAMIKSHLSAASQGPPS
jgi:hypothetical protein